MKVPTPVYYDQNLNTCFTEQALHSSFSTQNSIINIEWTISMLNGLRRTCTGAVNLFEILPMKSQIVCI